MLVVSHSSTDI
nr:unnamed protein product [Callosobruchus chinensis]